ncbi:TPA: hypothetical protein ACH5II_000558 [Campylobacter lari]|nr:hypothetical protein [Campylobacter lari]
MKELVEDIENAIKDFSFEIAEMLYLQNIDFDNHIKMDYILFLYSTAQFEKLSYVIKDFKKKPIWWLDSIVEFDKLKKDIQIAYTNQNSLNDIPDDFNDKYLYAAVKICKDIKNKVLTANDAIIFFKDFIYPLNSFKVKAYMSKILIDYFAISDDMLQKKFFFTSAGVNRPIWYLLSFLHSNSLFNGPRRYLKIYNNNLKKIAKFQTEYRIAFCFYGALRGYNWKNHLEVLIDKVAGNLNADCFLHTWNNIQVWPGLMGGYCWTERSFIRDVSQFTPKTILTKDQFRNLLPTVYKKIDQSIIKNISQEEVQELAKKNRLKKTSFKDSSTVTQEKWTKREAGGGGYIYYGIHSAFKLLEEYERENDIEYDYVVLMRVDSKIQTISYDDICSLKKDEISDFLLLNWGTGSGMCIGSRSAIKEYVSIYENLSLLQSNSCIEYLYNNHEVLYKYAAFKGLTTVKHIFDHSLYEPNVLSYFILPDVSNELHADLLCLQEKKYDSHLLKEIENFFAILYSYYPKIQNNIDYSIFCLSAKERVKNHLSYKIGNALIEKTKTKIGYFQLPFVLFLIIIKHNECKKKYKNLKKNHIQKCFDYQEAVKIQNFFSYRLGSCFIKACKNWYKGGIVKFLFYDLKLLKKAKGKL